MFFSILFIIPFALWFFVMCWWFYVSRDYWRLKKLCNGKQENDNSQYHCSKRYYLYLRLCLFVLLVCLICLIFFYLLTPTNFINGLFIDSRIKDYSPFCFNQEQFSIGQFCKISVFGNIHIYDL